MKFYLAKTHDSEWTRVFSSFKDAKDYAISLHDEFLRKGEESYPVTVYKMDVPINQDTVLKIICNMTYWNEQTEVFQIGIEEENEQCRQRLEEEETKTGVTFQVRRNDNE